MKKSIIFLCASLLMAPVFAESIQMYSNVTMDNFWQKQDKDVEKILKVSRKIFDNNDLKRAAVLMVRAPKEISASTSSVYKAVHIPSGVLPYLDCDDELAYIIAHEIACAQEYYDGFVKVTSMKLNPKKYATKTDYKAIDYMVNSGYNPIYAILVADKLYEQPQSDWGLLWARPKGSKRIVDMYKYIYKKYPKYLSTDITKSSHFITIKKQYNKEISSFIQKQRKKPEDI